MSRGRSRTWALVAAGVLCLTTSAAAQAPTAGDVQAASSSEWMVEGRPNAAALEALALLRASAEEGLEPDDYDVASLAGLVEGSADSSTATFSREIDVQLTDAMAAYLGDLHHGRVDPRSVGLQLDRPNSDVDFKSLVRNAAAANALGALVDAYRPPLRQYAALKVVLDRYRRLTEPTRGLAQVVKSVHPGEPYSDAAMLAHRLVALGDLDAEYSEHSAGRSAEHPAGPSARLSGAGRTEVAGVYDGALVEAVRRFQARHGLEADGVLGKATVAALNVPLAWRRRQIELALERQRWLRSPTWPRVLVLNIPMFELWGWSGDGNARPSFSSRVIVGKARTTATPVMASEMGEVIFRPYWNVPRSILLNEVLPIARRDPNYLRQQAMELVSGESDDAPVVEASTDNFARLQRGALRLRQRPGPNNALGLVKFVFPNDENVYMHATPAPALFSRSRRDFSHGCVRVQDAVALAEWVLSAQPGWPRQRILSAMATGSSQHVRLATPIHVLLFYTTAAVLPDGTLRFADDIYGHDQRLDRALATRSPFR